MKLPDFIIIGAMKSGTSTLHSNLQLHPEIGMSKFKEPNYFNKLYKNYDLSWYKSLFNSGKKINGESSPNYSKMHMYPGTAERMYRALPNVKIVYLTRDPFQRILSHLHHNLYRDRLKEEDIDRTVVEDENYLLTSKYGYQIEEYLKFYQIEQCLFITTEELKEDLNGTLNKICYFMDVQPFDFTRKVISRNKSANKFLIKKYDKARSVLPSNLMKLYHWLFYAVGIKIDKPSFTKQVEEKVKLELEKDVIKYKNITGIDISVWPNFQNVKE